MTRQPLPKADPATESKIRLSASEYRSYIASGLSVKSTNGTYSSKTALDLLEVGFIAGARFGSKE